MKHKFWIRICCCLMVLFTVLTCVDARADRTPYDWALIKLDYIRQEKVGRLERFMMRLHSLARQAASDQTVISFFELNRHYYHTQKTGQAPISLSADVEKMRTHFNGYYLRHYFAFYDILFVDMDGVVFHTLRR